MKKGYLHIWFTLYTFKK